MDDIEFADPTWDEGDAYFRGKAESLRELADEALISLESQALALREWFREERKRIQREAWEKAKSPVHGEESEDAKVGYAPINLFVKSQRGSLEIYWQEVHVRSMKSKARRYVYLARGKSFSYTEHKLRKSAKPFELELVLATERRAAQLREWWSIWSDIKRTQRRILKIAQASKTAKEPVAADVYRGFPELVPSEPRS